MNIITIAKIAATSTLLCAFPANAEQLSFTGRTTADIILIKDALRHIQLIGQGERNCGTISAVEATVLPESYSPRKPFPPVAANRVIYESWSANLCGDVVKFLISFWSSDDGGTMFAVTHPYPADAP